MGAHPAALVPKALRTPKKPEPQSKAGAAKGGNMMRMDGGGGGKSQKDYESMKGAAAGGAGYGAGMKGNNVAPPGPGSLPKGGGGGPAGSDFEKSSSDYIMVRALDFDVKPDATYRYRVRIVFANPNYNWESVAPGVDTKSKEKTGPWSPVTAAVDVPADIATYAAGKTPAVPGASGEEVHFEVVAWNETDGLTVVKNFDEAPGQVIGSRQNVLLPSDDKEKTPKPRPVDFTSHQVLADAVGGTRPASDIREFGAVNMQVPVMALVVRADGMLVLRDQAKDAASGELTEMKAIFEQIKSDLGSKSKKKSSSLGNLFGPAGGGLGAGGGGIRGTNRPSRSRFNPIRSSRNPPAPAFAGVIAVDLNWRGTLRGLFLLTWRLDGRWPGARHPSRGPSGSFRWAREYPDSSRAAGDTRRHAHLNIA